MLKHESLPMQHLTALANAVCEKYGITKPHHNDIAELYKFASGILPIVVEGGGNTLWVDRYYMALEHEDGRFEYLYVSRSHIREEYMSYAETNKERGTKVHVPKDIKAMFDLACRAMHGSGKEYFLFAGTLELDLPWIEFMYDCNHWKVVKIA